MVVTAEQSLAARHHPGESCPALADERLRSNGGAHPAYALRIQLKRKGASMINNPVDIILNRRVETQSRGLCSHVPGLGKRELVMRESYE
jgi:hypothetical protein